MPFTPGPKAAKLFESPVALPAIYETAAGGDRKSEKIKADNISLDSDLFAPAVPAKKKADAGTSRAAERPASALPPRPTRRRLMPAVAAWACCYRPAHFAGFQNQKHPKNSLFPGRQVRSSPIFGDVPPQSAKIPAENGTAGLG